jgi:hypothetical protein
VLDGDVWQSSRAEAVNDARTVTKVMARPRVQPFLARRGCAKRWPPGAPDVTARLHGALSADVVARIRA